MDLKIQLLPGKRQVLTEALEEQKTVFTQRFMKLDEGWVVVFCFQLG